MGSKSSCGPFRDASEISSSVNNEKFTIREPKMKFESMIEKKKEFSLLLFVDILQVVALLSTDEILSR